MYIHLILKQIGKISMFRYSYRFDAESKFGIRFVTPFPPNSYLNVSGEKCNYAVLREKST